MRTLKRLIRLGGCMIALGFCGLGLVTCGNSHTVRGSAGEIGFEDEGSGGLPVVLLHSFGGDRSHWEQVRRHVRLQRRVISIDLRGHGRSASPADGDFRISAMAEDVGRVVDALRIERFVLVGHSMGGSVALEYAGSHPDRVAGLVLVDAAGDPRGIPDAVRSGIKQSLNSEAYDKVVADYWDQLLVQSTDETKTRLLRDLKRIPRSTVIRVTTELLDYDPVPSLNRYRGPALAVVLESNDGPFALHHLSPGMDHRIVHNAGHWLQLDRPGEFESILDEFLAQQK